MLTKNIAEMKVQVEAHIAADAVVGGQYWEPTDNTIGGAGCFIGCLGHSADPQDVADLYGLPIMLQRVVENIFENVSSQEKRVALFRAIPDAIGRDGKDLSLVVWKFLGIELREIPKRKSEIQTAVDMVIAGMDILADGGDWNSADARVAAVAAALRLPVTAARDAADAVLAATRAAAVYGCDAARARSTAAAAALAANAAGTYAADAADACAADAAGARDHQAATILRLIGEAT